MVLDVTSLRKAIAQAEDALDLAVTADAAGELRVALHARGSAIQAFEFTYELAIKTLRRWLERVASDPGAVDRMTFDEVIRRGWEAGVLHAEIARWREFRRDRGITSHTYDEAKAQVVFEGIPPFLREARFLADALDPLGRD